MSKLKAFQKPAQLNSIPRALPSKALCFWGNSQCSDLSEWPMMEERAIQRMCEGELQSSLWWPSSSPHQCLTSAGGSYSYQNEYANHRY